MLLLEGLDGTALGERNPAVVFVRGVLARKRPLSTSMVTAVLMENAESRQPLFDSLRRGLSFAASPVIIEEAGDLRFSVSRPARTLGIGTRRLQMIASGERGARELTLEDFPQSSGFRDRGDFRRALASEGTEARKQPGGADRSSRHASR